MYSRKKVELFLLATEDGMGPTAAAEFAGVTVGAAKKWATGHLPRSYTGGAVESLRGNRHGRRPAWAPTSRPTPRPDRSPGSTRTR